MSWRRSGRRIATRLSALSLLLGFRLAAGKFRNSTSGDICDRERGARWQAQKREFQLPSETEENERGKREK